MAGDSALVCSVVYVVVARAAASKADAPGAIAAAEWSRVSWERAAALNSR